jgi:hypothetical protein
MARSNRNNNNNSWDYEYLGKSQKNGYEYQYRLNTVSVDNLDAKSPFDFSIHPKSLTVVKRPLKSAGSNGLSPLKQASIQREEQQSYEEYEEERRRYAKLGIPSPDGLGLFYSDYLVSQEQSRERQNKLKEIDD